MQEIGITKVCTGRGFPCAPSPQVSLLVRAGEEMRLLEENYQRITDDRRSFDIRFWQSQGDRVIFEAVSDMLDDYFLIRGKDANEFRLQRTVESFRKA